MITGLCITVPGHEVVEKMRARAFYHWNRKREYEARVAILEKVKTEQPEQRMSSYTDPLQEAKQGVDRHDSKAREYEYMAQWVDVNETFLLHSSDLAKLGIIKSAY